MPRRPSARRYAQALFQLALEEDQIEQRGVDLQVMDEALQEREFVSFLAMPKVRLSQKMSVIQEVFPDVSPLTRNLLGLLTSRGMADMLPAVRAEYVGLLDQNQGLERAQVVSAVPLEDGQRDRLAGYLKELIGSEIVLTSSVDPSIVAGLVTRVGDRLIDGSARARLRALRKSLAEAAL